jgi:GTP-binding protein LepA
LIEQIDIRSNGQRRKAGKKRMRQFGQVDIPQSAFIAALRMGES